MTTKIGWGEIQSTTQSDGTVKVLANPEQIFEESFEWIDKWEDQRCEICDEKGFKRLNRPTAYVTVYADETFEEIYEAKFACNRHIADVN